MIRAIFFDWFNTLAYYDPPREELHSRLLCEFGIEISPPDLLPGILAADKYFINEIAGSPVDKRSPEEQNALHVRYADIMLGKVGIKADKEQILQIIKEWPRVLGRAHFALFDDVLSTLKILKRHNFIIGILTNFNKDMAPICRKLGLEPYLDFVVTSEEAGADKPNPPIFRAALRRAGVDASEAIHVGDQYKIDVVGARGLGINPILIDRYDLYPEVTDCPRICNLTELSGCL